LASIRRSVGRAATRVRRNRPELSRPWKLVSRASHRPRVSANPCRADAHEVLGQQPFQRLSVVALLGRGPTLHQVEHISGCGHRSSLLWSVVGMRRSITDAG
jgi:hypothetical protein